MNMKDQVEKVLEDAVVAEIAFLLHAKLNHDSESTAKALLKMAQCYSDAAYLVDVDKTYKPVFDEIVEGMNDFTKETIGQVTAQLIQMGRRGDPKALVKDLPVKQTVIKIMGMEVTCYGKIDHRRIVVIHGMDARDMSNEPIRQYYLAKPYEAWLSVLMKLVPMLMGSDIYITELYGAIDR